MTTRLVRVPKPGRSRSGNHSTSTTPLMAAVDQPMERCAWRATPCAKTVQGVAPQCDWTRRPSPTPKRVSPTKRGGIIRGRRVHVVAARHGVAGMR